MSFVRPHRVSTYHCVFCTALWVRKTHISVCCCLGSNCIEYIKRYHLFSLMIITISLQLTKTQNLYNEQNTQRERMRRMIHTHILRIKNARQRWNEINQTPWCVRSTSGNAGDNATVRSRARPYSFVLGRCLLFISVYLCDSLCYCGMTLVFFFYGFFFFFFSDRKIYFCLVALWCMNQMMMIFIVFAFVFGNVRSHASIHLPWTKSIGCDFMRRNLKFYYETISEEKKMKDKKETKRMKTRHEFK